MFVIPTKPEKSKTDFGIDPKNQKFSELSVQSFILTSSLMADVGYPGLTAEFSSEATFMVIDMMAYIQDLQVSFEPGELSLVRYGVGMRLGLAMEKADISFDGDFKTLTAAAELGIARTQFEAHVIGIKTENLPKLPILGIDSTAKANMVSALGNTYEIIADFLSEEENHKFLEPQRVHSFVTFAENNPINAAYSHHAALERIYRTASYSDCLSYMQSDSGRKRNFVPLIAMNTYDALDIHDKPTNEQKDKAHKMLILGR